MYLKKVTKQFFQKHLLNYMLTLSLRVAGNVNRENVKQNVKLFILCNYVNFMSLNYICVYYVQIYF